MAGPDPLPTSLRKQLASHFTDGQQTDASGLGYAAQYAALATVEAVEDGDTWRGKRKPDPKTVIGPSWYRLTGIDTHETDGKKAQQGKKEKAFTQDWVKQAQQDWTSDDWPFVVVFDDSDGEVEGTYGRSLVDLIRRSDGQSLSQALIDQFGDGVKYQPNSGGDA